jgi:hypothetical protein
MNNNTSAQSHTTAINYSQFYNSVFLAEHRSTIAIATHVFGTVLGLAWVGWALYANHYWLLLAFPIVHAVPGLIGHRIAERNPDVGDIRITRKDFPLWWFIVGNHQMSWELISKGAYWRALK